MGTVTVGQENSTPIELYYEDHGSGPPVVLARRLAARQPLVGAPAARAARGRAPRDRLRPSRLRPLEPAGRRLRLRHPGRRPRQAAHRARPARRDRSSDSRWAPGELARYIGTYGTERLAALRLHRDARPVVRQVRRQPQRAPTQEVVSEVQQAIRDDRFAWLTGLVGDLLNLDENLGSRVSEETVRATWNAGADASPLATWACPPGWLEDFTQDIERIDVPTLILHGTADRILPDRGPGPAPARRVARRALRRDRGRPARHVRDPRQGGQRRARGVPAPARRGRPGGLTMATDDLAGKLKRTELQRSDSSIPRAGRSCRC